MSLPPYIAAAGGGTRIDVFVQPRVAKDAIVGVHGAALKLKVKAPPLDGRANEAAANLVARLLDLAPSKVSVVGGHSSRHKRLEVADTAPEMVACELERVLSSRGHDTGQALQSQEERGEGLS